MKAKEQVLELTPYQPGKPIEDVKRELGLERVEKLASNENPFGASSEVKEAISDAAAVAGLYPDGYATLLRQTIANDLNLNEKQLLFGAGSDEVILMLCRTFLGPGTNTVMAEPTFSQYKHNAVIEGTEIREVPLIDGVHDLNGLLAQIDKQTRIVWVCNPNNPSGTYVNETEFKHFMERVPEDVLVVSDEAYIEYVSAADYPETLPMLKDYPNLVLLRTFSKAYGMAALRVGFGIGSEELMQTVDPVRPPFNTTTVSQAAALAAWKDQDYISWCREKTIAGKKDLEAYCKENQLTSYPSEANFLLIDTGLPGHEVFEGLLKKGVIVRSGEALGFPTCIRVTIGSEEQNKWFKEAMSAFLSEQRA
ncbi:histidinol-phosphate transaminase [Salsuginibacillus kocurii]|uniref:histidinol-phosphate transaminase n=1 Tax=Salsuginibacillus kocurii TaxID=427078 RepID=UPI000373D309|nr:histidinol-phosphate transaminase [Salsuginibacillus kocurii]